MRCWHSGVEEEERLEMREEPIIQSELFQTISKDQKKLSNITKNSFKCVKALGILMDKLQLTTVLE